MPPLTTLDDDLFTGTSRPPKLRQLARTKPGSDLFCRGWKNNLLAWAVTLLGFNFAFLSLCAQTLTVNPAAELQFPTVTNMGYRILRSSDFGQWEPVGPQIFGDGAEVSRFFSASTTQRFFQTERFVVRDVSAILEQIRRTRNVPALACAVVRSNRIVGFGVTGLRKSDVTNAPVTITDKWHHGSLTKSMTATLAAMLIAEGRIQWTNTLAEVFPDFASRMHPGWRTATLEQLSSNRGGAPENIPGPIWTDLWNFGGTPREGRRQLLERMTTNAPASTPGTRYEYSNTGFALAGHMLETVMDQAWEDLLSQRLFVPLEMSSAGFGVPATPRHINHPWGHTLAKPALPPGTGNSVTPMAPGVNADNPPAIGPAGTVHCSVLDLAIYVAFHLAAHKSDTPLLRQAAALKLHRAYPNNANYAHGWIVTSRPWANGDALTHTGSNTQWYSNLWLAPNRDFAVVALCNLGGDTAFSATDDIAARMIGEFLP
jgi:CubicO group peptidase (beta-lactamase class C family)